MTHEEKLAQAFATLLKSHGFEDVEPWYQAAYFRHEGERVGIWFDETGAGYWIYSDGHPKEDFPSGGFVFTAREHVEDYVFGEQDPLNWLKEIDETEGGQELLNFRDAQHACIEQYCEDKGILSKDACMKYLEDKLKDTGATEIFSGCWLFSSHAAQKEQEGWSEEDPGKDIDFERHDFWLLTDSGENPTPYNSIEEAAEDLAEYLTQYLWNV
jgi:hypothetical protein